MPRIIPLLGLIGAPLLLASDIAVMFGALRPGLRCRRGIAAVPIALWEFSLGVYLVVKGFKPSPITAGMTAADTRPPPTRTPPSDRRRHGRASPGPAVATTKIISHRQDNDMTSTTSQAGYPVRLTGELDPNLSRWLWLVKMFLAIPHYVVLAFLWVAFLVTTVIAGFAIVFTGRYPRSLFDFNVGVLRWNWRVGFYVYAALGTDRYPPFTLARADYPADIEVAYPEHPLPGPGPGQVAAGHPAPGDRRPHRRRHPPVLVDRPSTGRAGIQPIGGYSVLNLLVVLAGFFLLITGQYPRGLFDLLVGINRWLYRVLTYVACMHDEYPPFRLDQGPYEPGDMEPDRPATAPASSHAGLSRSPRSTTQLAVVRLSGDPALVEAVRRPHLETAHAERAVDHQQRLPGRRFPGTFTDFEPHALASRSVSTAQPSGSTSTIEPAPPITSISISSDAGVASRQSSFTPPMPWLIRMNGGTVHTPRRFSTLTPPSRRRGSSREYPADGGPWTRVRPLLSVRDGSSTDRSATSGSRSA